MTSLPSNELAGVSSGVTAIRGVASGQGGLAAYFLRHEDGMGLFGDNSTPTPTADKRIYGTRFTWGALLSSIDAQLPRASIY
jgi:hypothetical protein